MNMEKKQLANLNLALAITTIVTMVLGFINNTLQNIATIAVIVLAILVISKSKKLNANSNGALILLIAMGIAFVIGFIIGLAAAGSAAAGSMGGLAGAAILFLIVGIATFVMEIVGIVFCFKASSKLNAEAMNENETIQNNDLDQSSM